MQMGVAWFFFNAHWARVTSNLSDSVAADVAVATQLFREDPTDATAMKLDALLRPDMELSVVLRPGDTLPTATRNSFFSNLDKTLRRSLTEAVDMPFWFDTTRYPNHIDIRIQVDEGVLRFIAARERVFAPTGFVFIFWLITTTVVLSVISVLFIRRQSDPIRELADAAAAFGKGQDISGFKPRGASEVRLAGQSFLKMRRRLRRHLEQRTLMLAGVSHDLRTPLTRLKLQLAMQDDSEDTRAAKRDVDEMDAMLTGYLDFARGMGNEKPQSVQLVDFISQAIENRPVAVGAVPNTEISIRPLMLKRCLGNLIGNALKYGDECALFKAFQRLDGARNQNIEGIGLGLSISQDIAQLHGGKVLLADSEMGGLKATLRLPL